MQPKDFKSDDYRLKIGQYSLRVLFGECVTSNVTIVTTCIMRIEKIGSKKMKTSQATYSGVSLLNPKDFYVESGGYIPALKNCYENSPLQFLFTWHDLRLALRTELEK